MVSEQDVDEPISSTNPLQQHSFCGVIQEPWIVPRSEAAAPQHEPQGEVLNASRTGKQSSYHPEYQSAPQSESQPVCEDQAQSA